MADRLPKKTSSKSIASVRNLSLALDIPEKEIISVAEIPVVDRYSKIIIQKKSGKDRIVYDAIPRLRIIQHRINTRIFKKLVKWPEFLYGSLPNDVEKKKERHR